MLFILLLRQGRPQRTAKINTRQFKYIYIYLKTKIAPNVQLINMSFSLLSRPGVCVKPHLHEPPLHYWRCVAAEGGRANAKKARAREERVCLALRGRILPQTNHHRVNSSTESSHIHVNPCEGVEISFSISCDAKCGLWRRHNKLKNNNNNNPNIRIISVFLNRVISFYFFIQRCVGGFF